jgi:hypothetical protein
MPDGCSHLGPVWLLPFAAAAADFDLEALAVPGPVAGTGSDSATVAGVGQVDPGQVAQGVRDQDGYLPHDDVRTGRPQAERNSVGIAVRSRQMVSLRPRPAST